MVDQISACWIQESVTGDVTEWLTSENVSFLMRQAAWAARYGSGKNKLSMLVHDGTFYAEQLLDMAGRFRTNFKLGGDLEKILLCEGAPLVPLQTAWIQGKLSEDGSLEFVVYDEEQQKVIRQARRFVTENGMRLVTEARIFLSSGAEALITQTYRRTNESPLTIQICSAWCPVLTFADRNPVLKSAVTDSLDEFFASQGILMDSIEHALKYKELGASEKNISFNAISNTEFSNEVTMTDDSQFLLKYELEKEALAWKVVLIADGAEHFTYFFRILTDPLRLESWVVLPEGDRISAPAVSALEEIVGAAIRRIQRPHDRSIYQLADDISDNIG